MPHHIISLFLLKLPLPSSSTSDQSSISPSFFKMKNKAATIFKQIATVLAEIVKSKSVALKNKAIAMKTRLIIFRLIRNKKVLLSAMANKMHSALMGHETGGETSCHSIVQFNAANTEEVWPTPEHMELEESVEDDDYPDLRHYLFDLDEEEEDGLVDSAGSVIEWVRNHRDDGEEFNLEDEIDHVADVFIRKFHRQMRLEKQESFKRYQEMLERSV